MFKVKLEKLQKWATNDYKEEEIEHRKNYKGGYLQAVRDIIVMYEMYGLQSSTPTTKVKTE